MVAHSGPHAALLPNQGAAAPRRPRSQLPCLPSVSLADTRSPTTAVQPALVYSRAQSLAHPSHHLLVFSFWVFLGHSPSLWVSLRFSLHTTSPLPVPLVTPSHAASFGAHTTSSPHQAQHNVSSRHACSHAYHPHPPAIASQPDRTNHIAIYRTHLPPLHARAFYNTKSSPRHRSRRAAYLGHLGGSPGTFFLLRFSFRVTRDTFATPPPSLASAAQREGQAAPSTVINTRPEAGSRRSPSAHAYAAQPSPAAGP
ncbi:hypothetical protein EXIGLDRAFT_369428 [Exidia glandulosa HHB12029]|uniref:Uncharacterized protein n=1 Tax=Exidia glandulosa HHB12029 TaxID=1314781 RepID=A0A165C2X5_EXIGL|nr:hypothetical protein EXIGLDRAFT_369428 [Exidia glandulosa HHB12029]